MSVDAAPAESPWRWLTQMAFILTLAVVIARMTSMEILRDPWDATPGSPPIARGPGAGAGLVMDLLAVMPALLVLARRALDADFRLTPRWSHLPMLLLGLWVMLSTSWAADKFLAIVSASHWLAGLCLAWAASQLIRSWVRFRLVAALCFGMLLLLVAQSMIYRFINVPADQRFWSENRIEFLKQRGWEPGSFAARQFENRFISGDLMGFFTSPNTFAAVGVLLLAVSAGIGIQKTKDGDGIGWSAITVIAGGAAAGIIAGTGSKTAWATPFLGAGLLLVVFLLRRQLHRRAVGFYWAGVGVTVAGIAAGIAQAVYRGGLFQGHFGNSLDFRWKYWVAATQVFKQHATTGVGWGNFGLHYLGARLPEAAEEVRDPHNFLVRFFVETGIVGGALIIGWLLRLLWETTRPHNAASDQNEQPSSEQCASATVGSAVAVVVAGSLLSMFVNVDFTQPGADVALELLRRLLYLLALLLGTVVAAMLSPHKRELDARPAPWLLYCSLIGLGLFLIHNLVDFSLFETGPMYGFLLLAGAVVGIAPVNPSLHPRSRGWAAGAMLVAGAAWLAAALALTAPIVSAEQSAYEANEAIRTARPDHPDEMRSRYSLAARELRTALDRVPYNADYAFRAARSAYGAGDAAMTDELLAAAIAINPLFIDAYLMRANVQLRRPAPDVPRVRSDFDAILRLNPNDVGFHQSYGEALERFGLNDAAATQYELALKCNAALPQGEPKRLPPEQLTELSARITRLSQGR